MIAPLLFASLAGCMNNPLHAPYSAAIEGPASVDLAWSESVNGYNDGYGAVILADFFVYDTVDDLPLANIEVEVISNSSGVYLIPPEALRIADYPSIPEGYSQSDCIDENGNFDNLAYEWCGWVYDTLSGQYFEFGSDYADNSESGDAFQPTYLIDGTDDYGLLRVYVYVDSLPATEEGFSNVQIVGTIGHDTAVFEVGPGGQD